MRLKELTFILENCDWITISGDNVGYFLIDDIHTCIERIACNSIEEINTANIVAIEINKNANKDYYQFELNEHEDLKLKTFDRLLNSSDITGIDFELVNDCNEEIVKKYHYCVNWTGDSDYLNLSQKTFLSESGNLYLVIAENKDIPDFFNLSETEYSDWNYF